MEPLLVIAWNTQFKRSDDKTFAEKLPDVVGLYVALPAQTLVLPLDEKSQIRALNRTQPRQPLKKGRGATMTRDYKRHVSTTLFAALNVLTGEVSGRTVTCCKGARHRHQDLSPS